MKREDAFIQERAALRKIPLILPVLLLICGLLLTGGLAKEQLADPTEGPSQEQLQQMQSQEQEKSVTESIPQKTASLISSLPEDSTPVFNVSQIQLEGNTLLSRQQLFKKLPVVFDASGEYDIPADSTMLYDFRGIQALIEQPDGEQFISARTMQGLTQYLLSVYQRHHYAGIYVYIPEGAMAPDGLLSEGILPIRILEASVSSVGIESFDVQNLPMEESYLSRDWLNQWSPAKTGQTLNDKELQDFISILNLNPDRYISAVVSEGDQPQTLAVDYNLYEANPWHWFAQVDNSGTDDREWTPRFGLINTNLLGFDDRFTAIYQTPVDSDFGDEYAVFGSYDFPILGPKLRLNLFGGYNEYDVSGLGDFNFIGRGHYYGGQLRWHAYQSMDGWFVDLTGMIRHEESEITPNLFPDALSSDVEYGLWGYGIEIYQRKDRHDTFFSFNRVDSFTGSDQDDFTASRSGGADRNFSVLTTTARHSRYLDPDKIQRLTASFEWISSDERLVPSMMRTFGGMYTVRGYDEYEIVADGGILASLQYEYDLIRADRVSFGPEEAEEVKPFVRKLAPLVFTDYGQARIEDATASEDTDQELFSVGGGCILELGDNFTGVVYYGYPLIDTERTHTGKGRVNAGFLIRW